MQLNLCLFWVSKLQINVVSNLFRSPIYLVSKSGSLNPSQSISPKLVDVAFLWVIQKHFWSRLLDW